MSNKVKIFNATTKRFVNQGGAAHRAAILRGDNIPNNIPAVEPKLGNNDVEARMKALRDKKYAKKMEDQKGKKYKSTIEPVKVEEPKSVVIDMVPKDDSSDSIGLTEQEVDALTDSEAIALCKKIKAKKIRKQLKK
jgi:hypothetical protein